eukprot:TRINITY_DN14486_c0_g1_i1.p1 TRINITY_DN14486_c0_g1~~TRINITY_DN14486_c0_g1_i1.p1  ORF type:complete len:357 (+),score=92.66 TRINITY_DN14486_c0_g1_i1:250-1320(+)
MAENGKFLCYAPNHKITKWIPVRNNTDKVVQEKLDSVVFGEPDPDAAPAASSAVESPGVKRRSSFDMRSASEEERKTKNQEHSVGVASWTLPGGGIAVDRKSGPLPHAPGLVLVRPVIFSTKDTMIAFNGYLSNATELINTFTTSRTVYETKLGGLIRREAVVPPAWKLSGNKDTLEAEVVLRMYEHLGAEKALPLLRGRFAFVLYDSSKNRVFAARDPSGHCSLFEAEDEDGGLLISSSEGVAVPGCFDWDEIPPGHFVLGRRRGLQRYAEPDDPEYLKKMEEAKAAREFEHEAQNELSAGERYNKLMAGLRYHDQPGGGVTRSDSFTNVGSPPKPGRPPHPSHPKARAPAVVGH